MHRLQPVILAVLISAFAGRTGAMQIPVMAPLTTRLAREIKHKEPSWRYTAGWCTCPPLVSGQLSHDVDSWERKDREGNRELLDMDIYKISTAEEASEWIRRFGRGDFGKGCEVEKYQLGDEAYLLKCPRRFKSILYYNKSNFIVAVTGDSQSFDDSQSTQ